MIKNLFKNKAIVLLIFSLIGLLVHFKSFQMVPYGDDWTFIYDYLAHEQKLQHVNTNYLGLFSFLTPYGPAILTIGAVYQFFGKTYFVYYLIPLIFKILTAFFLFLILESISSVLRRNNFFVNFLVATLFLVGFAGLQSIDWSMNMNIYIGIFIFALGLFYQSKYYLDKRNLYLFISPFLFLLSIVVAPTRFTPLILIVPLMDIVLLAWGGYSLFRILLIKNIFFCNRDISFFTNWYFWRGTWTNNQHNLDWSICQFIFKRPLGSNFDFFALDRHYNFTHLPCFWYL